MQTYDLDLQNFFDDEPYQSNVKPLCYYVDTENAVTLSKQYGSHLQNILEEGEKLLIISWVSILLREEQDSIWEAGKNPDYENIVLPDNCMIDFIDSLNPHQKRQFLVFLTTDLS